MREKLIELLDKIDVYDDWFDNGYIAEQLIANGVTIPVRCKECKAYDKEGFYCEAMGFTCEADDFCSYGERRTDG